jgi:hypothetical protein
MIKDFQETINAICAKFNNKITQLDIVAWLENFDKEDWKRALIVLNNFEFFSTEAIIREFDNGLKLILENQPIENRIYLVALGKIGKSGATMMYYLKKTPTFMSDERGVKRIEIIQNEDFSTMSNDCNLVIVDDYAGTGDSIVEYYNVIKGKIPNIECKTYALTIAFMSAAKHNLIKSNIEIIGNERIPVFSTRGSVFGYYPKAKGMREFCFKYGNKLYSLSKYKKYKGQHPLGFKNTQALIGFEHSIPNNTLPIIWATCKVSRKGKNWVPIFSRNSQQHINKAKEFRDGQIYWASIIYKLGLFKTIFQPDKMYDKEMIQLISMISLKKMQKNILYICQILGVNLSEYETIIELGQKKGLFDLDENITEQADKIYEEVKKKTKIQKSNINRELTIDEDFIYIPKKFQGGS